MITCRTARVETGRLQRCPYVACRAGALPVRNPADRDRAGIGCRQTQQQAQGGRLARPVGSQESGHPSGRDGEGQVIDSLERAEGLRQTGHVDRPIRGIEARAGCEVGSAVHCFIVATD